jgi:hypothetical protein
LVQFALSLSGFQQQMLPIPVLHYSLANKHKADENTLIMLRARSIGFHIYSEARGSFES